VSGDERNAILTGLREGDTIITSGTFIVAAESRIRSAAKIWIEERARGAP
jgi:hypothetical protein